MTNCLIKISKLRRSDPNWITTLKWDLQSVSYVQMLTCKHHRNLSSWRKNALMNRPDPVRNKNVLAPLFGCQRILGVPLCSSRGWKPALLRPLPADFLRVERHRSSPRHAVCFFILINHRISFFLHLNLSLGRLEITIDRFDRITIDSMANLPAKYIFP